jgi:hypothetical protein
MRLIMKHFTQRCAVTALMALALAGCKSSSVGAAPSATANSGAAAQSSTTQASGKAASATYVSGSPLSSSLTTATITDPSLNNMVSATLTIPAKWTLQGITMISPCTSIPWSVYRAYSPDSLMQMRSEPVFGWRWHPNLKGMNNAGCADISTPISAADFLQYYLGTIQGGVHVVGTMPVASQVQQWAQSFAAAANQNQSRMAAALQTNNTADTAALRIQTVNGSFVVEERLRAVVECSVTKIATGPLAGGTCWARVDVLSAPQGGLDALAKLVDDNNLPKGVNTPEWMQAALQRQQRQGQQAMAALTAQEQQESKMLYQQFQQIMQRSQAEHQAFMQQQESQFQSAMNNANASMNAQSTSASDWVDYSLDQQTVMSPNGTLAKVSSAYSQTWTNGTQWFQTNDANSNPNGVLNGNWTQTTKVHGNGTP